jgi:hypothetical protein
MSVRIYDKTEELGLRSGGAERSDKAARETEIWARHGWTEGEAVTRVEVQVRGTALDELCRRCEVKVERVAPEHQREAEDRAMRAMIEQFEHAVDGIWQYATRKWLVLIEPRATRNTRCKTDPWWEEIQEVSFVRKTEKPLLRIPRKTAARSAQVLGSAMSVAALNGIHCPWIDTRKDVWMLPEEEREARKLEHLGLAKWRLDEEVERLMAEVAPIIVRDLVAAAGNETQALARFIGRYSAATCRYSPDLRKGRRTERRLPEPRQASA